MLEDAIIVESFKRLPEEKQKTVLDYFRCWKIQIEAARAYIDGLSSQNFTPKLVFQNGDSADEDGTQRSLKAVETLIRILKGHINVEARNISQLFADASNIPLPRFIEYNLKVPNLKTLILNILEAECEVRKEESTQRAQVLADIERVKSFSSPELSEDDLLSWRLHRGANETIDHPSVEDNMVERTTFVLNTILGALGVPY